MAIEWCTDSKLGLSKYTVKRHGLDFQPKKSLKIARRDMGKKANLIF